ncbi:exosortase H [Thiolapillus sp.]|uniref:exosortase H n=1 Tax=Thiolapillus sp. TaxID=2017437 RepID=UPI0034D783DB
MLRFFLIFLAIQAALFTAELTRPVQQAIVIPFTESIASLSAWLIKAFDSGVIAYSNIIRDQQSGFAVAIEAGCNGVEATIVLVAAMLAMPTPWKLKLIGIGSGFLAIQFMNLLRIITLFYLDQWNRTAFDWAHLYIWQALIMLDVLIVFLIWLRFLPSKQEAAHVG